VVPMIPIDMFYSGINWRNSCNAKNECILILDDDRLPSEDVNKMYFKKIKTLSLAQ
jgi:hypothetical protein